MKIKRKIYLSYEELLVQGNNMSTDEQAKKKQYFQYGLWMLLAGIISLVIGGYVLRIELSGSIGMILAGAGIIVLVTNWT
ncbi:MAG: hypothetical protein NTZ85_01810 [Bacteroidia bacterium]|nr:hypothetical protein [Bacteroidia bacterium]